MRWIERAVVGLLRAVLFASLIGAAASPASAQFAQGTIGWISPHSAQPYPSADAACRAQWQYYNGGIDSRYIGVNINPGNPNRGGCSWTQFQYLCRDETGGGINSCGTTFPTWVELRCDAGYVPVQGQFCLKDSNLAPERPCEICELMKVNNGATVNPAKGDPVVLSTGSVIAHSRDYATADGDFVIGRSYRSISVGRSVSFQSAPVGLASGWNFDFMYELQLASFSGSPSTPNAKLALVAPNGTAYDFVMQPGGAWVPDTTTGAFYAPTNLKLEFVGSLPSDLSTLQSAPTRARRLRSAGPRRVWPATAIAGASPTAPTIVFRR